MSAPGFLERFERVTPAGIGKWRTRCPHCGSDRGLSFGEGDDKYLLHPFCGCRPRDVLATVELRFDDLRYESTAARGSFLIRPFQGGYTSPGVAVNRLPSIHRGNEHGSESEVDQLLRMVAAGQLDTPNATELPPLPDNATDTMRRVAEFFQLVHAVRGWAGMEPEVMFASTWVANNIGMPQPTVWRALRWLEAAGVLKAAGSLPGRNGRRGPRLYVVGEGAARAQTPPNVVRLKDRRAA